MQQSRTDVGAANDDMASVTADMEVDEVDRALDCGATSVQDSPKTESEPKQTVNW
jgi:hypothetical protein